VYVGIRLKSAEDKEMEEGSGDGPPAGGCDEVPF
jgi:hypothetical protein